MEKPVRFTKLNSLNDILSFPDMKKYLHIFYSDFMLDMFPDDTKDLPLLRVDEIAETPWDDPFSDVTNQLMAAVDTILDLKVRHLRKAILLWDDNKPWDISCEERGGKNRAFLLAPEEPLIDRSKKHPAVVLVPGGGYTDVCFSGEGNPMILFLEAHGYTVFTLRYRVGEAGHYPAPQDDLARAITYVREHADDYSIDPNDLTVIGFSAGGHLCLSEAALHDGIERPDRIVVGYPVVSFVHEPHEGSALYNAGEDKVLREKLSVENMIGADFPPTFAWACEDDDCVPVSNTRLLDKALSEKNIRHETHIYPTGGHGCWLAFANSAHEWSLKMLEFIKK